MFCRSPWFWERNVWKIGTRPFLKFSYQDVTDGKWQSILTSKEPYRKVVINEMSGFAKDDWKIKPKLTLNFGLRWEYYS